MLSTKCVLLLTFFNQPEFILFRTIKWFHLFVLNKNNSVFYLLFVCKLFNVFKYCYISLTIQSVI